MRGNEFHSKGNVPAAESGFQIPMRGNEMGYPIGTLGGPVGFKSP